MQQGKHQKPKNDIDCHVTVKIQGLWSDHRLTLTAAKQWHCDGTDDESFCNTHHTLIQSANTNKTIPLSHPFFLKHCFLSANAKNTPESNAGTSNLELLELYKAVKCLLTDSVAMTEMPFALLQVSAPSGNFTVKMDYGRIRIWNMFYYELQYELHL